MNKFIEKSGNVKKIIKMIRKNCSNNLINFKFLKYLKNHTKMMKIVINKRTIKK